jgi:phage FluMu protein Com
MEIRCANCQRELSSVETSQPCPQCGGMDRAISVEDQMALIERALTLSEDDLAREAMPLIDKLAEKTPPEFPLLVPPPGPPRERVRSILRANTWLRRMICDRANQEALREALETAGAVAKAHAFANALLAPVVQTLGGQADMQLWTYLAPFAVLLLRFGLNEICREVEVKA